ncbi:MAG: glycosyl hydrolase 108 family protein [Janthinobacterium lividum]
MADFANYFPLLVANEGGYVHDPNDPGGETWRGIARVFNPHWAGWPLLDAYKARPDWPADCQVYPRNELATAILERDAHLGQLVQSFYQANYWDNLHLGGITDQAIASQLCDIGVNSGVGRVGHLAQYVLASCFGWRGALDGQIGPATLEAINAAPSQAYYDALVATRRAFYQYRAGHSVAPPALVSMLESVRLVPDNAMQRYLPAWLGRVAAIPYTA